MAHITSHSYIPNKANMFQHCNALFSHTTRSSFLELFVQPSLCFYPCPQFWIIGIVSRDDAISMALGIFNQLMVAFQSCTFERVPIKTNFLQHSNPFLCKAPVEFPFFPAFVLLPLEHDPDPQFWIFGKVSRDDAISMALGIFNQLMVAFHPCTFQRVPIKTNFLQQMNPFLCKVPVEFPFFPAFVFLPLILDPDPQFWIFRIVSRNDAISMALGIFNQLIVAFHPCTFQRVPIKTNFLQESNPFLCKVPVEFPFFPAFLFLPLLLDPDRQFWIFGIVSRDHAISMELGIVP